MIHSKLVMVKIVVIISTKMNLSIEIGSNRFKWIIDRKDLHAVVENFRPVQF